MQSSRGSASKKDKQIDGQMDRSHLSAISAVACWRQESSHSHGVTGAVPSIEDNDSTNLRLIVCTRRNALKSISFMVDGLVILTVKIDEAL